MDRKHQAPHAPLTAAEVGNLWNFYLANTMSKCMFQHFIQHVEDPDIKVLMEACLKLIEQIITETSSIVTADHHVLPKGFGEEDVNPKAPRLFNDSFYLHYMDMMMKLGTIYYAITLPNTSRLDVRGFLSEMLEKSMRLSNKTTEVMLEKGMYTRPPIIHPHQQDIVHKQSFFNGFWGDKRPLLGVEISQLYANIQFNTIKYMLMMGFAQVAQQPKVKEYFLRGVKTNEEQSSRIHDMFRKEDMIVNIPDQMTITDSTEAPYSDKLMLFHISNLSSAKVRNYGDSVAVSPRHDLSVLYGKLIAETGNFAEDCGNLLIEFGWMEQPPHAIDRHKLAVSR